MSSRLAKPGVLRPVARRANLTHEITERIAAEIAGGSLPPGSRLPTEQDMVEAMGVSRTVVREAVAALRADGLVTTRQGAGVFVAADAARRPFRLAVEGLTSIEDVLEVMELRAGIETEAAGLAAARATRSACRRIGTALNRIDAAIRRGESAVDEDFGFHRALAEATGNEQFAHFLAYLGRIIIPRQSIRVAVHETDGRRAYLEMIQSEHRAIFACVESGDVDGARDAMRAHLTNSQARYRRLVAEAARSPGSST